MGRAAGRLDRLALELALVDDRPEVRERVALGHVVRVVGGAGQVVEPAEFGVDAGGLEPQDRRHLGAGLHHPGLQAGRGLRPGPWRAGPASFSNGSTIAPSGSRCCGTGVIAGASAAPDADCGVGPPLVEAIGGLSSSSGTGAQVMSWVPDRPAASAGVVWHLEQSISLVPSVPVHR